MYSRGVAGGVVSSVELFTFAQCSGHGKGRIKLIILVGVSWLNRGVSIPVEGRWWYGSEARAICVCTVKWMHSVR